MSCVKLWKQHDKNTYKPPPPPTPHPSSPSSQPEEPKFPTKAGAQLWFACPLAKHMKQSCPYCQIMALSMMKDEERLDLLKEIGGSKVYEDRRRESLRILQDADGRKRQIAELVTPHLPSATPFTSHPYLPTRPLLPIHFRAQ